MEQFLSCGLHVRVCLNEQEEETGGWCWVCAKEPQAQIKSFRKICINSKRRRKNGKGEGVDPPHFHFHHLSFFLFFFFSRLSLFSIFHLLASNRKRLFHFFFQNERRNFSHFFFFLTVGPRRCDRLKWCGRVGPMARWFGIANRTFL